MRNNLLLILFSFLAFNVNAQITTATLSGQIKDLKGEEIPGVNVLLSFTPTGAKYVATTNIDGRYTIANMNPGGPYKVSLSSVGYKSFEKDGLTLPLGHTANVDFRIIEATSELKEVIVTGQKGGVKMGSGTNINEKTIEALPSLSRSLTDLTRMSPNGSSSNSFAGTNFRYNNVTIDGSINNDAIGFSPSLGGFQAHQNAW